MNNKIHDFTDLTVWKLGHEFVLETYKETLCFPNIETYGLISQLRRSAFSVTSNIAEDFSRFSFRDKMRFYYNARGSLSESQNHIIISRDIGYMKKEIAEALLQRADTIRKLLNGLIRSTESQIK